MVARQPGLKHVPVSGGNTADWRPVISVLTPEKFVPHPRGTVHAEPAAVAGLVSPAGRRTIVRPGRCRGPAGPRARVQQPSRRSAR